MKKNPILIFSGVAIAAVAVLAAVTKDKWMPSEQAAVTEPAASSATAEAPAETAAEQQATAAAPEATTTEQQTTAAQPSSETAESNTADAATPGVPTFDTVRVEKTGETVIAGRADPGAEVAVKLDGKVIGKTVANADGAFVLTPEAPLPVGSGTLTLETMAPGATEAKSSEQSVAVIVPEGAEREALVAVISPDKPTKVLQKPAAEPEQAETAAAGSDATATAPASKQVSIDAVDYDDAGNIVFSGKGEPGTGARIYVDNAIVGDAKVDAEGRWTHAATEAMPVGNHTLRVDGIDAAGSVMSRVEVPFFREDKTKVAAADTQEQAASGTGEQAAAEPAAETSTAAAQPEAAATGPKEGRIVIQPGNNLWRISKVIYGDGLKFAVLYDANKDQIRNPDLIYPGQVFRTPDVEPPEDIDPAASAPVAESGSTGQ